MACFNRPTKLVLYEEDNNKYQDHKNLFKINLLRVITVNYFVNYMNLLINKCYIL